MKKYHVSPYLFENYLILSFSKDWINLCNTIPEFEITIDQNKRLHLISKQKIRTKEERVITIA